MKRLQQILKNLLSNAFKFTAQGYVAMTVRLVKEGWSSDNQTLSASGMAIMFSVRDTGIGIAPEKQKLIFEAFQQADAGTSRKYGGTGLGLAISRELANLLGGEIRLRSTPGEGSTFTLYLPPSYTGPARAPSEGSGPPHARPAMPVLTLAKAEEVVSDDRDDIQPGRVHAAHRRRRSPLRAHPARDRARQRVQRPGGLARACRRCRWLASTAPRPSPSTCSSPTCWGGRC